MLKCGITSGLLSCRTDEVADIRFPFPVRLSWNPRLIRFVSPPKVRMPDLLKMIIIILIISIKITWLSQFETRDWLGLSRGPSNYFKNKELMMCLKCEKKIEIKINLKLAWKLKPTLNLVHLAAQGSNPGTIKKYKS